MEKTFFRIPMGPFADYLSEKVNAEPSEAAKTIIRATRKMIPVARKVSNSRLVKRLAKVKIRATNQAKEAEPYQGSFGAFGRTGKNS